MRNLPKIGGSLRFFKISGIGVTYWRLLRQPQAAYRRMRQSGLASLQVGWVLIAGFSLCFMWAAVFQLGGKYETGQLLSVIFLLGGPVGVLMWLLSNVSSLLLGRWRTVAATIEPKAVSAIPPFPFKNLVWRKLLGTRRLEALFQWPGFSALRQGWSWLLSHLRRGAQIFKACLSGLSSLLAWQSITMRATVVSAALQWIWLNFLEAPCFGAGPLWQWGWLLLSLPCWMVAGYHRLLALRMECNLSPRRAALSWMASWLISIGILMFLLSFVMGITLF